MINELRLGSWVHFRHPDKDMQMTAQDFFKLGQDIKGVDALEYFGISPIELNEKWLKNSGFKKEAGFYNLVVNIEGEDEFTISISDNLNSITLDIENPDYFAADVVVTIENKKYVHQLQNLYQSLTNQEL